jgi:hypothetical protein
VKRQRTEICTKQTPNIERRTPNEDEKKRMWQQAPQLKELSTKGTLAMPFNQLSTN